MKSLDVMHHGLWKSQEIITSNCLPHIVHIPVAPTKSWGCLMWASVISDGVNVISVNLSIHLPWPDHV
jgi:hypothetical protein